MFTIRMADLLVEIHNRFPFVERLCREYLVDNLEKPDLRIEPSVEDIQKEVALAEQTTTPAYAEAICIYRLICSQLPSRFDAYLLHGAVIEYEGKGYIFTAKSGTGKSTHISFWQKHFGSDVKIVNGDKPILRFKGDTLYAYGTPWCGKEGFQTNTAVPVVGLCFLERASKNAIRPIDASEAITRIFYQILTPSDLLALDAIVPLLDRTLTSIPCYVLQCNMSTEAAEVAYRGMCENSESKEEIIHEN